MPTPVKGEAAMYCACGHSLAAHLPPTGWCAAVVRHLDVDGGKPMPVLCPCEDFIDAQLQKETTDKERGHCAE